MGLTSTQDYTTTACICARLEIFARFDTQIGEETRRQIERGRRVREALKQSQGKPIPVPEQIAVLLAATEGLFDGMELREVKRAERAVRREVTRVCPDLCRRIEDGAPLRPEERRAVLEAARQAVAQLGEARTDADP